MYLPSVILAQWLIILDTNIYAIFTLKLPIVHYSTTTSRIS